ncbi:ABC transporter permease [Ammonifex thiophilus]|uniref:Transport permease protein n=2 Tax=Ammonifex thiophilus TaxID=444093 RepID=A0A3D8P1T9_9THEO|nr:ABC transporter permease [Ammonifex thiophilus]
MWRQMKELYLYREMLRNLVAKELRARYKGSVLGFFWTFLNPLLMLVVYSLVFSFVMRAQMQNYAMFLFVGLLPWNYLANSLIQGTASLVHNASLVKKIYFPREVLPLSVVLANLVNYLLSLLILIPALLIFKVHLTAALAAFPLVLLVQTLLVIPLTLLVSVATVYFRDLEHIMGILTMAWFFLTPVIYPSEIIPPELKPLFNLNPAAPIIEAYQAVFFYGRWPDWASLGWLALGGSFFLVLGFRLFDRFQRRVAEEI